MWANGEDIFHSVYELAPSQMNCKKKIGGIWGSDSRLLPTYGLGFRLGQSLQRSYIGSGTQASSF